MRYPFHSIDLSITNQCNAKCIYCPTPRNKQVKRHITIAEINKLIDDLTDRAFVETYGRLGTIEIGGLFEPLLHDQVLDILRIFKYRYVTNDLVFYTNGLLLGEDISQQLLEEDLITQFYISVDGVDDREHRAAKGVSFNKVQPNLMKFIEIRDNLNSKCKIVISALPYARYVNAIQRYLGRNPLNVPVIDTTLIDHTDEIIGTWRKRLRDSDEVQSSFDCYSFRGEYKIEDDPFPIPEEKLYCPWINYVVHAINITSNGDWMICFNDFLKENVLGNIFQHSLYDIATTRRDKFVKALIDNDISNLPSRCRHKKYCQYIVHLIHHYPPPFTVIKSSSD